MKNIVYIDDEANSEAMISKFEVLEEEGWKIIPVVDIKDAIPKLREYRGNVHLIILDIIMPPKNLYTLADTNGGTKTGLKLLEDIRKEFANVPIMILSVMSKTDAEEQIHKYSVIEFLSKPIDGTELAAAISNILHR